MPDMITLKKTSESAFDIMFEDRVKLGETFSKEDGFYDFWPEQKPGYMPSWMLKAIARVLDELNAPYEKELAEYFDEDSNA